MADVIGTRPTTAGIALLAKAFAGKQLVFTRGAIGDSFRDNQIVNPAANDQLAFNALIHEVMSVPIASISSSGGNAYVKLLIENTNVDTTFQMREIGLFAKDPDTNQEILYCYANFGDFGKWIFSNSTSVALRWFYTLITAIGTAQNVTAVITVVTGSDYVLPVASTTVLGGIKIGTGVELDSNDKLNLKKATASAIGGVKPGTGLEILADGTLNCLVSTAELATRLADIEGRVTALENAEPTPDPVAPTLSLSEFTKDGTTYTATITYNGDGTLSTTLGTINNKILTITDADGGFSGTLSASATANYLAKSINFSRAADPVAPTLSLSEFTKDGTTYTATITYNGDGTLSTTLGTINNKILTVTDADGAFSGTLSASATSRYLAASLPFSHEAEPKLIPTLAIGKWEIFGTGASSITYTAPITYDGDGTLSTSLGEITSRDGGVWLLVNSESETFSGTLSATEGERYQAASITFVHSATSDGDGLLYNTMRFDTDTFYF